MANRSIISQGEALRILENDLREKALKNYAAELNNATPERRSEILAQIDRQIRKELRKRARSVHGDILLH